MLPNDRRPGCRHAWPCAPITRAGLFLLFALSSTLFATDARSQAAGDADATDSENDARAMQNVVRLRVVQQVIDQKQQERETLEAARAAAGDGERAAIREELDAVRSDIDKLTSTLETLATGGADESLFAPEPVEVETAWRDDLALIAKPILDSLKDLTEKPRRINELNELIAERQQELTEARRALRQLREARDRSDEATLDATLDRLIRRWERRENDADDEIEIATLQRQSLESEASLLDTLSTSTREFIVGRGFTLALAALLAAMVYVGLQYLLKLYRKRLVDRSVPKSRTRYRLAEYSMRLLGMTLVLLTVFLVFYERGDVLLLGLLILLIAGLVLSVRHLLPRYMEEARLLLNVGPLREGERVVFRGLPWRVESVNMYCVFRNPELQGILRLPLNTVRELDSRPVGQEPWFPTSRGDIVLLDGATYAEVLSQNPDTVELQTGGGQIRTVPTAEFFGMNLLNLTRGERFGVWINFGIDYRHQDISIDEVPKMLRRALHAEFEASDIGEFLIDATIEFSAVGDSSLDYVLFVLMDTRAAKSYLKIQRMLQRACVNAANENALDIPFPHLTVVKKDPADAMSPTPPDP